MIKWNTWACALTGIALLSYAHTAQAYKPFNPYNMSSTNGVTINLDVLDSIQFSTTNKPRAQKPPTKAQARVQSQAQRLNEITPAAGNAGQAMAPVLTAPLPKLLPPKEKIAPKKSAARILKPSLNNLPPVAHTPFLAPIARNSIQTPAPQAISPIMPKQDFPVRKPLRKQEAVASIAPTAPSAPILPTPVIQTPSIIATVPSAKDLTLVFAGNEGHVDNTNLQQKLSNIVAQMTDLDGTRIQVRAYATGEGKNKSSARRISLSRALAVRGYLMDHGISPSRVDVRALGQKKGAISAPQDRVDLVFVR